MADLLVHHWSHPTTPAGLGWDIVQTGVVRLTTEKGYAARAALGEAEIIRVLVDDPTGTADYKTLHRWYMVETATSGSQLVWNGYIVDQYIDRGEEGDLIFPTGVGRRWELEIAQENTIFGFRVIQGAKTAAAGDRPEESPGARLRWLLASPFLSTVIDHGLIDWTRLDAYAVMDAVDYRKQTAGDVLRDISLKTGYNHYARYRDDSSDIEMAFYNSNVSSLDSSTLRVSNSVADLAFNADGSADFASNLTWPPHHPVRLHRKGDRVAAGVLVEGADGIQSYGYNLDTSYEFGFRDMVVADNNTKTQAQADRLRDRLLAQHDEQDERITGLRIQVPAANLNSVKHGQRIEAKFVHLPGWESFRWARVVSKSFSRPDNETQALYDVDLELSPQSPAVVPYAVLYRAQTGPEGGGNSIFAGQTTPISWVENGDTGHSIQYPNAPTVGPMTFIVGKTPDGLNGNYLGILFGGEGDITVTSTFTAHTACDGQAIRVNLLLNGAVVATGTTVTVGPGPEHDIVINATISVADGDRLTAEFKHEGTACGIYLDYDRLTITGTTIQVP